MATDNTEIETFLDNMWRCDHEKQPKYFGNIRWNRRGDACIDCNRIETEMTETPLQIFRRLTSDHRLNYKQTEELESIIDKLGGHRLMDLLIALAERSLSVPDSNSRDILIHKVSRALGSKLKD